MKIKHTVLIEVKIDDFNNLLRENGIIEEGQNVCDITYDGISNMLIIKCVKHIEAKPTNIGLTYSETTPPTGQNEILNTPVSDLDLKKGILEYLTLNEIKTIGQLSALTENDLRKFRNFGDMKVAAVKIALSKYGLKISTNT